MDTQDGGPGPGHCVLCGKADLPVELHRDHDQRFLTWACADCAIWGQVFNGEGGQYGHEDPGVVVERIALMLVPAGGRSTLRWTIERLRALEMALREDGGGQTRA